ncbi:MAG: hypothetical protein ABSH28_01740 [Acidobacteriota bacterium]|jgi:hypothetical protein
MDDAIRQYRRELLAAAIELGGWAEQEGIDSHIALDMLNRCDSIMELLGETGPKKS